MRSARSQIRGRAVVGTVESSRSCCAGRPGKGDKAPRSRRHRRDPDQEDTEARSPAAPMQLSFAGKMISLTYYVRSRTRGGHSRRSSVAPAARRSDCGLVTTVARARTPAVFGATSACGCLRQRKCGRAARGRGQREDPAAAELQRMHGPRPRTVWIQLRAMAQLTAHETSSRPSRRRCGVHRRCGSLRRASIVVARRHAERATAVVARCKQRRMPTLEPLDVAGAARRDRDELTDRR